MDNRVENKHIHGQSYHVSPKDNLRTFPDIGLRYSMRECLQTRFVILIPPWREKDPRHRRPYRERKHGFFTSFRMTGNEYLAGLKTFPHRPIRYLIVGAGLLLTVLLASPLEARGEEPPVVRADLGYASHYVFRGIERASHSAQAAVEGTHESWRGGLWTNLPFESGETRELSLSIAYAWQPTGELNLEASLAGSWFDEVPGGGVKKTYEAGLTATLAAVAGFTPSLAYYHDFRLQADTAQFALARSIALTRMGAFLELNGYVGWAAGDDWRPDAPGAPRHDSYGYWGVDAQLPYRIGAHTTVTAGLHYADNFERSPANGPFGLNGRHIFSGTLGVNLDF